MKKREILSAIGVGSGWALVLFSVAAYLLFWRVDNEPGVAAAIARPYLITAIISFLSGSLLFLGNNLYLLLVPQKKTALLIAWVLVIGITLMACTLSPCLLILLV